LNLVGSPHICCHQRITISFNSSKGKKFEYYRQLDSLEEYVLISQQDYHIDIFRKNAQERWELFSFSGLDAKVCFESIDCCIDMYILYEDVSFDLQ
jgi:Uma2 family endonuclease